MLLKPCERHRGLHSASRAAVDANVFGLVGLQQFLITAATSSLAAGNLLVRTFTIIDTDYFNLCPTQKPEWIRVLRNPASNPKIRRRED